MPNWACGSVSVTGTKQNISKFISRFIYEDDSETEITDRRFFARSFTNDYKQSVLEELENIFIDLPEGSEGVFVLAVDFAWSAHSCLIDGYPQKNPECITLGDACVEDHVSVIIQTEESGNDFEEFVSCDRLGQVSSFDKNLTLHKCLSCGTVTCISSFQDADESACFECDNIGLEPVGKVLT
jgi:hypothetical protein